MPFTAGSFTSSSTWSISGPSGVMSTFTIRMPKCWVMAKCRSYPGTGQRNLISGSLHQGLSEPYTPERRALVMQSYIMLRLELPPTIISSCSTPSISARSFLTSGRPSRKP